MGLEDVAAIVEAEPVRPHWTTLDDALAELGFTANTPTHRPHTA